MMIDGQLTIQDLILPEENCIQNVNDLFENEKVCEYSFLPIKKYKFKSVSHKYHKINITDKKEALSKENSSNMEYQNLQPIKTEENMISTNNNVSEIMPDQYNLQFTANTQLTNNPNLFNIQIYQFNPYFYQLSPRINNSRVRKWTKQEDERLMHLINVLGPGQWNVISSSLGTRTAKQCRDHYANCLNPEIRNSQWTNEEEEILLLKYSIYGPKWSKIREFFPGRTNSMVKNHLLSLLKNDSNLQSDYYL